MPNFTSISFKMTEFRERVESAPHVCVIQKTHVELGLN